MRRAALAVCNSCNCERKHFYFRKAGGSYSQPCLFCDCVNERLQLLGRPADKPAVKPVEVVTCKSCIELGHRCKICSLIKDYRRKADLQERKKKYEHQPKKEEVPLLAVERTKEGAYTLFCERCKKRKDPKVVHFVGAIGSCCWTKEEWPSMWQSYQKWSGPCQNSKSKTRQQPRPALLRA